MNIRKQKNIPEGWEFKGVGELLDYEQPTPYIVSSTDYNNNYKTPVLTAGKTFLLGYTDEISGIYKNAPVIIFDDFTTAIKYVDFPFKVKSSAMKILKEKSSTVNLKFIYGWMQVYPFKVGEHKRNYLSEYQYRDVLIPSFHEQNAIIEILEIWNKYLEKLSKKIEIKKNIKKGLMQRLLTRKVRLDGFDSEWRYKTISQIAKTSAGGTPKSTEKSYYVNGEIPWLKSGEIRRGEIDSFKNFITDSGLKKSSAKVFPVNTVLVAMYGATAGQCGILKKEASTNQAICGILPNNNYSHDFLYYFFTTQTEVLLKMGTGAAQPNISQDIIKNYDIYLPELKEQKAIAKILKIADQGIKVLEEKKQIIEDQKKFLLNNLVTGKIRVPEYNNAKK